MSGGGGGGSSAEGAYAEAAAAYLARTNLKGLIEWMAVETMYQQPSNPVEFLAGLLAARVSKEQEAGDGTYSYSAGDAGRFLAEAYARASTGAAPALQRVAGAAASAGAGGGGAVCPEAQVLEASRRIAAELDAARMTRAILEAAQQLTGAVRASLFRVEGFELVLMEAEGRARGSIRLARGAGLAGSVAASNAAVRLADAYEDARFDRASDAASGFRTRSVLAVPVRDGEGRTVGVLQMMNKGGAEGAAEFSAADEQTAQTLALHAGVALRNSALFEAAQTARTRVRAMVELVRALHSDDPRLVSVPSLLFTLTTRAPSLVDAERCTFFLADHRDRELISMQGEVNVRLPMGRGIAGAVAATRATVNIADAHLDPRFDPESDRRSGFRTRAMLCMPVVARGVAAAAATAAAAFGQPTVGAATGDVGAAVAALMGEGADESGDVLVGVIQLINKRPADDEAAASGADDDTPHGTFSQEDVELLEAFLGLVAPILLRSQLFQARNLRGRARGPRVDPDADEAAVSGATEAEGRVIRPGQGRDELLVAAAAAGPAIVEGEEEEEEEDDGRDEDD